MFDVGLVASEEITPRDHDPAPRRSVATRRLAPLALACGARPGAAQLSNIPPPAHGTCTRWVSSPVPPLFVAPPSLRCAFRGSRNAGVATAFFLGHQQLLHQPGCMAMVALVDYALLCPLRAAVQHPQQRLDLRARRGHVDLELFVHVPSNSPQTCQAKCCNWRGDIFPVTNPSSRTVSEQLFYQFQWRHHLCHTWLHRRLDVRVAARLRVEVCPRGLNMCDGLGGSCAARIKTSRTRPAACLRSTSGALQISICFATHLDLCAPSAFSTSTHLAPIT